MKKSSESFYKNLKLKLDESHIWPSKYVFKFIIKNNLESIDELISYFPESNDISKNFSSNKKFVSFTIKCEMHSSEGIIKKYKDVSEIVGIISL
jgi:3-methyladenine DNA glycosylase Tag